MNKLEFIEQLAKKSGVTKADAGKSLQTMLEDSGIKAIIMGDDVRWCRFRRCSPVEEEVLDASTNEEETQSLSVPWPPPGDDGAEDTDSERAQSSEPEH